ncbi:MAG TPA: hypothetical protein VL122_08615 [Nitrospirota bacterium]|nr:hypothetical protein [Nitrospirota bacterium]
MKRATVVLLIGLVLLSFAGKALAAEMGGLVTAVDHAKGTLTLEQHPSGHGRIGADFVCENVSLIQDVEKGQHVNVTYDEVGGKKIITKVTPMKQTGTGGWK